eukprot:TRINITY_DN21_c3_g1_i1.p1 TRINITY_DN21_c3_g1~~TRINITY_DN21_c3_g1_i1.p1  ORF type:complete len:222 (+),score=13.67 TRINITY_DN21_c3_g1_i1:572-1237(+)
MMGQGTHVTSAEMYTSESLGIPYPMVEVNALLLVGRLMRDSLRKGSRAARGLGAMLTRMFIKDFGKTARSLEWDAINLPMDLVLSESIKTISNTVKGRLSLRKAINTKVNTLREGHTAPENILSKAKMSTKENSKMDFYTAKEFIRNILVENIAVHSRMEKEKGDFRDGEMTGIGEYRYADGAIYTGEMKEGKANGHGSYKRPTGQVLTGLFEDGELQHPS